MAVLSDILRQTISDKMEDQLSQVRESISIGRQDLRDAINAADKWIDANAASFNNALPLISKTNLTVKQKSQLLVYVIRSRWEVS